MAAPREVSSLASTSGRASMRMRSATVSSSPACSGEIAPPACVFARRSRPHLSRSSPGAARIAAWSTAHCGDPANADFDVW